MALLDDAENLLAVLLASLEDEGDSRAMQAEAVLKVVRKKLNKAHVRIDRQERSHRNAFLAYFELKGPVEESGE
jgi:rubrerythrin